jgi:hypothetical protein
MTCQHQSWFTPRAGLVAALLLAGTRGAAAQALDSAPVQSRVRIDFVSPAHS